MPTPTVEPSSGTYWPMNVFVGTSVVKVVSLADSRPLASLATAWTLYCVAEARCWSGVPAEAVRGYLPADRVALAVGHRDGGQLALVGGYLQRAIGGHVLGVVRRRDGDHGLGGLGVLGGRAGPVLALSLPEPSPPPHAVTSSSNAPRSRARSAVPWPSGAVRPPAESPRNWLPVHDCFSPRTAWPRHRPYSLTRARPRARTALDNHTERAPIAPSMSPFSPNSSWNSQVKHRTVPGWLTGNGHGRAFKDPGMPGRGSGSGTRVGRRDGGNRGRAFRRSRSRPSTWSSRGSSR